MLCTFLKAKLHHARVTHSELEYEGSCAIDKNLMQTIGLHENEQIHIYNLKNGERWITYAITAPAGSCIISVNGAAAHKADVGDRLIICTYAAYSEAEFKTHKPIVLRLNEKNQPVGNHPETACVL